MLACFFPCSLPSHLAILQAIIPLPLLFLHHSHTHHCHSTSPSHPHTHTSSSPSLSHPCNLLSAVLKKGEKIHSLNIVLLLPPAPAALVELGLAFANLSFWSAAALRLMAVLGPPGGVGLEGRPVGDAPVAAPGVPAGEEGRGAD